MISRHLVLLLAQGRKSRQCNNFGSYPEVQQTRPARTACVLIDPNRKKLPENRKSCRKATFAQPPCGNSPHLTTPRRERIAGSKPRSFEDRSGYGGKDAPARYHH